MGDPDIDLAPVEGVLESIREEVGDNLIKLYPVDPHHDGVLSVGIRTSESDITLVGIILIEGVYSVDESHQIGLLAVQMHLVLVDLPLIEDLVDEQEQALGIAIDRLYILLILLIGNLGLQFVQRS